MKVARTVRLTVVFSVILAIHHLGPMQIALKLEFAAEPLDGVNETKVNAVVELVFI